MKSTKSILNKIVNKDAIKFIEELNSKEIFFDLILTDPPYNISRENNFKTIGRNGIDFGSWDYNFDQLSWIDAAVKILKTGGSILIFNDWKNMGQIANRLQQNGLNIKDIITWKKTNPMPRNTTRRYVSDREFCLWAVKGQKWTFNNIEKNGKYLRPEIKESVALGKKRIHPTQKSIKMIEKLIQIHSNPGDWILDPFSGSGAITIAAFLTKRNSLASEIDLEYYQKSLEFFDENKKYFRSPLYYIGDKYKILKKYYHEIFPLKINSFYDVFGGGGGVIANVHAKKRFYNDINKNVSEIIELLSSSNGNEVIKNLETIIDFYKINNSSNCQKVNKESYILAKKDFNEKKYLINKETHLLFLIIFGFNSNIRFNSKGEFNIPIGKGCLSTERKENLLNFCQAIKQIKVYNNDFSWFKNIKYEKDDFLYFDPPYLVTNAPYNNIWDESRETELYELLDFLNLDKIRWSLSNVLRKGDQENKILKNWISKNEYKIIKTTKQYNSSNYQRKNAEVIEIIVRNW